MRSPQRLPLSALEPGFFLLRPNLRDRLPPVVTLYLFILGVGAVGAVAYLLLFMSHVPGAADERLGKWEPLPDRLGEWVKDTERTAEGLIRESRQLLPEGGRAGAKIVLQVRYRDPHTQEIVRVEPEVTWKRKRIRPS